MNCSSSMAPFRRGHSPARNPGRNLMILMTQKTDRTLLAGGSARRGLGVAALAAVLVCGPVCARAQQADETPGAWEKLLTTTPAGLTQPGDDAEGFWTRTGRGMRTILGTGNSDVFVPGYIWHTPWQYSDEQLARYNTNAFGLGYGRTLNSRRNRPRTLYGIVSADSYSRPQYMVGYAWRAKWRPGGGPFALGGGYTAMLIGRYDKLRYTPLPIALPLGSIGVDRFELMAAYVPGYEVGYFFLKLNVGSSH